MKISKWKTRMMQAKATAKKMQAKVMAKTMFHPQSKNSRS